MIPVSIVDRTRENGENPADIEDLQRRYDVDAFPTLIVFSPRSGKTEKTRGFGGPERTVAWILQAAHQGPLKRRSRASRAPRPHARADR